MESLSSPIFLDSLGPETSLTLVPLTAAQPQHSLEAPLANSLRHLALARQGCEGFPLLKTPYHGPLWPSGQVGSISHGGGWAGCLLAKAGFSVTGLGLDLEAATRTANPNLVPRIASPAEQAWLDLQPGSWGQSALELLCLKEALYKCLQPRLGVWFGFLDATVTPLEPGCFQLEPAEWLVKLGAPLRLPGQVRQWQNLLMAQVVWMG